MLTELKHFRLIIHNYFDHKVLPLLHQGATHSKSFSRSDQSLTITSSNNLKKRKDLHLLQKEIDLDLNIQHLAVTISTFEMNYSIRFWFDFKKRKLNCGVYLAEEHRRYIISLVYIQC